MQAAPAILFLALDDSSHGRYIVTALLQHSLAPRAIFVASASFLRRWRRRSIVRYLRRNGFTNTAWRVSYRLLASRILSGQVPSGIKRVGMSIKTLARDKNIPLVEYSDVHSEEILDQMRSFAPDYIVLGGAPILRKRILVLPRKAVLNAHPGVLPQARGVDVVAHSVLNDIPLGISIFEVNGGIDTGPILKVRYVKPDPSDTLDGLVSRVESQAGEAMSEAIGLAWTNQFEARPQCLEEGRLFHAMGLREYLRARSATAGYIKRNYSR